MTPRIFFKLVHLVCGGGRRMTGAPESIQLPTCKFVEVAQLHTIGQWARDVGQGRFDQTSTILNCQCTSGQEQQKKKVSAAPPGISWPRRETNEQRDYVP